MPDAFYVTGKSLRTPLIHPHTVDPPGVVGDRFVGFVIFDKFLDGLVTFFGRFGRIGRINSRRGVEFAIFSRLSSGPVPAERGIDYHVQVFEKVLAASPA